MKKGTITSKLESQIKDLEAQLNNKSLGADEREFLEEDIADLKQELADIAKMKETTKKGVHQKPQNQQPKEPKEQKETVEKKEKSTSKKSYASLKVGEEITDDKGNVAKRTSADAYVLEYHKNKTEVVAFTKSGDKWLVDCCKKKGIEFKADEIDVAIEYIIEGLDCHYEVESRKENAKKRSKAREKYDSLSEAEKIENTIEKAAESVENRVEDLKDKGKQVTPSTAKTFVADITQIVTSIKKGIEKEAERKDFIKSLIAELQKEL